MSDYSAEFLKEAARIAASFDPAAIDRVVKLLCEVRASRGRVFFLGTGGGASHASHAVNDLRKVAGIEAYAPTDNVAELTARINDEGWETSYVHWLRGSFLNEKDAVFVFSVGGGSLKHGVSINLVRCVELAKSLGAKVAGIVGRDGGYTAQVGDQVLLVPCQDPLMVTALTESFQSVLWHAIVSHPDLRRHEMKWESER